MVWKITIIDNRGIDKNSLFRRSAEIALELLDDRRLLRRLLALGPDKHQPEDHADEEQLLIRIRFFDAPRKVYTAPGIAITAPVPPLQGSTRWLEGIIARFLSL